MGRELKRVPMDFSWPLNEVWGGYLNPYYSQSTQCPDCSGSGYSKRAKEFGDQWYGNAPFDPVAYGAKPLTLDHPAVQGFARRNVARSLEFYGKGEAVVQREARRLFDMWKGQWNHHLIQADVDALVTEGRLYDFTRLPRTEEQRAELQKQRDGGGGFWLKEHNGYSPTADEVNAWSLTGFGHDACNMWICLRARCEREGIAVECERCKGEARLWPTPEIERLCEEWQPTEPPTGDGFQLWETTSEGSPTSPVFDSIETLCEWCAENATTFGSYKASAEKWRQMLDADFVCHETDNGIVFL